MKLQLVILISVISCFEIHGSPNKESIGGDSTIIRLTTDTIVRYEPGSNLSPRIASGYLGIDIDQDFFLDMFHGKNYDRNYTQGTAFSYSKYDLHKSPLFFPMNLMDKVLFDKRDDGDIAMYPSTIAMGVTAFTPLEIADSLNPVIGDRPFANVVFLTTAKNRFNNRTKLATTTSFSYGIIGSNIGNVFQSNAHTVITGRPTNIGWQYQISRGGHFAFLFSHSAMRSVFDLKFRLKKQIVSEVKSPVKETQESADRVAREANERNRKSWLQGSLGYRVNVGWYTGIAGVASLRFGRFSRFSNFMGTTNALNVANKASPFGATEENGKIVKTIPAPEYRTRWHVDWYFFGTASPRLTPYNSLLLGQPGVKTAYTLPKENYNPFVLDFEVGALFSVLKSIPDFDFPLKNIDIVLSFNGRTSEIISKDPTVHNEFKRTHYWGRVSIRFPLF